MNEGDKKQNNLFEVCTHRQTEWFPTSSNDELLDGAIALGILLLKIAFLISFLFSSSFYFLDSAESDDEFEILG
jgi:hypothetical protein